MTNFKDLNLSAKILVTLEKKGYTKPTPIQEKSIPHVLQGKDILGIAQTGTGKTASFSLPILDILSQKPSQDKNKNIRALILTPTRELASQIADNIKTYGYGLGLSYSAVFGGVSINNQVRDMQRGFDILVATPGRLIDLMDRRAVRLDKVEILVLDEADRMLDMGFIRDVKKIISKLPQTRQTLFFSATMPSSVSGLADSILNNPVKVEVTPQSTTVEKIDQRINFVNKDHKKSLLKSILTSDEATSVLVFSKTKHGANRIGEFLYEEGIQSASIHGNKTQAAREKALKDFKNGKVKVLIATDIAARGIDVPEISHVINYDIPHDPENYVHRIGRTARAGRNGIAISFCDASERILLKAIERTIKYTIPVDKSHEFHDVKLASSGSGDYKPRSRKISSGPRKDFAAKSGDRFKPRAKKISSGNTRSNDDSRGSRSDDFRKPRSEDSRSGDFRKPRSEDSRGFRNNDSRRNRSEDDSRGSRSGDFRKPRSEDSRSGDFIRKPRSGDFRKPRSDDDSRGSRSGDFRKPRSEDSRSGDFIRKPRSGDFRKSRSGDDSRDSRSGDFRKSGPKPKRFGEDRRRKDGFDDRKGTAKPSKSHKGVKSFVKSFMKREK